MTLMHLHNTLLAHFGSQHWWPAETPFEVMVGTILTQNTAWTNVERAIAALKAADVLSVAAILAIDHDTLATLIRPAGYFNVKARRLKALCQCLYNASVTDAPERLAQQGTLAELRVTLLAVNGVGAETADSILLYALGLPIFVVDTYTRRSFTRLGLFHGEETYAAIQARFHSELPTHLTLFNEYHALIVALGKHYCRPTPRCANCPLNALCHHAQHELPLRKTPAL